MERDWYPHLNPLEPVEEFDGIRHLSTQLHMLQFHEDRFASVLALMSHVDGLIATNRANDVRRTGLGERAALAEWNLIAADVAALTVYHFQSTLRSIRDQLKCAPTLAKRVDTKILQSAYDRFKAEFPEWKTVRDGVGHFADKMFKPSDIEELGRGTAPVIHGGLMGRQLTFTQKGRSVRLDVTQESFERLRSIKREAFEAFGKHRRNSS